MFLDPKWRHGLPWFDIAFDLYGFDVVPKNDNFWMHSRCSPKSEKCVQYSFQDVCAVKYKLLLASGVHRTAPFSRTGSSGKRYKQRKEGSNTPEARGPASFCSLSFLWTIWGSACMTADKTLVKANTLGLGLHAWVNALDALTRVDVSTWGAVIIRVDIITRTDVTTGVDVIIRADVITRVDFITRDF